MASSIAGIVRSHGLIGAGRVPHLPQQHVSLAGFAWSHWIHSSAWEATETPLSIAKLADSRGVLRLAGEDAYHFLQGIITNDVTMLQKGSRDVLYSAFLNSTGRFLHDAFLYATGDPFAVLADVDRARMPDLLRLIKRYKLRAKVDVTDVSEDFDVWARFGDGAGPSSSQEGQWPQDPRTAELGQRALLPRQADAALEGSTSIADEATYRQWRIERGVAEGGTEIPSGSAVPLEYNLDGLGAISFTKGCYVGQELIARTHFRGVVRKRLMPVQVEASPADQPEPGCNIFAEGAARPVGKLEVLGDGGAALALLRLEAALGADRPALHAGVPGGPALKPQRPAWWPPEWGAGG